MMLASNGGVSSNTILGGGKVPLNPTDYEDFVSTGTSFMASLNGTRCVGSGAVRIGPILSSDASGMASRTMTDDVYTQFGAMAPLVGDQLFFQLVYRDSVGAGGNWTDGLCVVFGN